MPDEVKVGTVYYQLEVRGAQQAKQNVEDAVRAMARAAGVPASEMGKAFGVNLGGGDGPRAGGRRPALDRRRGGAVSAGAAVLAGRGDAAEVAA
jgi:hypothetical protein